MPRFSRNSLISRPCGPVRRQEVGQGPLLPIMPAVANAVFDAIGVRIDEVPITPDKILRALAPRPPADRACRTGFVPRCSLADALKVTRPGKRRRAGVQPQCAPSGRAVDAGVEAKPHQALGGADIMIEIAPLHIRGTDDRRARRSAPRRRAGRHDAPRRRNGSLAEHETPPAGSARRHWPARGDRTARADAARRRADAGRHETLTPRLWCVTSGCEPNAPDSGRRPPRSRPPPCATWRRLAAICVLDHTLHLLRPELRMAQGDQLLHEEGRRHLLGRPRRAEVPRGVVDRYGADAAGAWRARATGSARGESAD